MGIRGIISVLADRSHGQIVALLVSELVITHGN